MLALILSSQATCATPDSVPAARAQALCLGTCPWSVSDDDADKVRALPPQSEPRPRAPCTYAFHRPTPAPIVSRCAGDCQRFRREGGAPTPPTAATTAPSPPATTDLSPPAAAATAPTTTDLSPAAAAATAPTSIPIPPTATATTASCPTAAGTSACTAAASSRPAASVASPCTAAAATLPFCRG